MPAIASFTGRMNALDITGLGKLYPTGTEALNDVALQIAQGEFFGEIIDTGVCHMALFTDPDGNDLMLHHRYAPTD